MIGFVFLFRRECHRFMKVLVQTVLTPLINSTLYLLIFGLTLGEHIRLGDKMQGHSYLAFLIPGLMMMGLINNAFQNSSSSLVSSKFTGDIEDLGVVPLSQNQIIWAMSLASVIRGAIVALITMVVGEIFALTQGQDLVLIAHPFWFLFFMICAGLLFGMLGLITAVKAKTFDQLSAVSTFVILPLTYLGGVFVSTETLHPFWKTASELNPLFYLINGLRFSFMGAADVPLVTSSIVALVSLMSMYLFTRALFRNVTFTRW